MAWMPFRAKDWIRRESPAGPLTTSQIPPGLRIVGSVLRVVFIVCLVAITLRVSLPQNETVWTAYDTPFDLIRMALGFVICVWIAVQLFRTPKDAEGYRIWLLFGLAAVPFALICLFAIW